MHIEIVTEEFSCEREGLCIRGIQVYPKGGERCPIIIFSHGFTGCYADLKDFCTVFARMGYAAFAHSFCGGSADLRESRHKSDGATTEMSVLTEVRDLLAVKDYAKAQSFTDESKLVLAGFSQGGFVSGIAAARSTDVSKLILVFPALCIPDHARRGCLGGAPQYDPLNPPQILDCGRIKIGRKFHEEAFGMDPYLELSGYKGPVLLLQGTCDSVVNYSYAIRAKEEYGPGQCHLQLIREMDHGYDENMQESLIASMRQFLQERKEILTIRVILTHREESAQEGKRTIKLFFTGYCETPYFRGTILPGACDTQEYEGDDCTGIRAEYTLEGLDCANNRCKIHVVNQKGSDDWEPVIDTDSEALSWLSEEKLTAVLEHSSDGPTVRIFAGKDCAQRI